MPDLKDIFNNKITRHCSKWEPYFDVYERYFSKFRNTSLTMIEIGVDQGGSLQLWREYFGPNARIIGIDNNIDCIQYNDVAEIYIGDQEDTNFWDQTLSKIDNIDIILDDGGHLNNQQIVTFEKLFPKLNYNGVYICEDTHTSYWPRLNSYQDSFINYSKKLIDYMHSRFDESKQFNFDDTLANIVNELDSITFYNSMVVFTKQKDNGFNYVTANPHQNIEYPTLQRLYNASINR